MDRLSIALNTQTPLVRFHRDVEDASEEVELATLAAEEDYTFTTGGVTRMVRPLAAQWLRTGRARRIEWVALNGHRARDVHTRDDLHLSFVHLAQKRRSAYAQAKEGLWALLNGLPNAPTSPYGPNGITEVAWQGYDAYQEASADALQRAAKRADGLDVVYVHDFQQLGVAGSLDREAPRVFHLHTPFPDRVSDEWADFFRPRLHKYDAVIVSSDRYARALRRMGYRGRLHRVYPFVDPQEFAPPQPGAVDAFRERYGLRDGDRVILNVARMDPMKGQDRLIRTLPRIVRKVPEARLVLVGNGSFSSSKQGGLGLSKGARWRRHLEELAADLDVADRVTFTGHLADEWVPAAYACAEVFAMPSVREGFGLAAVEAWLYGKPVVVSGGAGVAELVEDNVNGFVVDTSDAEETSDALVRLLDDPVRARQMGAIGRDTASVASLTEGSRQLDSVLTEIVEARPLAS